MSNFAVIFYINKYFFSLRETWNQFKSSARSRDGLFAVLSAFYWKWWRNNLKYRLTARCKVHENKWESPADATMPNGLWARDARHGRAAGGAHHLAAEATTSRLTGTGASHRRRRSVSCRRQSGVSALLFPAKKNGPARGTKQRGDFKIQLNLDEKSEG